MIPPLHLIAAGVAALYGLVALVGGIIGYVRAGSVPSLVAGGISGVLLLLCASGIRRLPVWSLVGALILALALLAQFGPRATGLTAKPVRAVDIVMSLGGVLVIVLASLALASERPPPP